jgi:hypothetical protein
MTVVDIQSIYDPNGSKETAEPRLNRSTDSLEPK